MKDVFDMTQEELDDRFQPAVNKLVQEQFDKVGYVLYQDERCAEDSEFIREYKDGRKELVKMG